MHFQMSLQEETAAQQITPISLSRWSQSLHTKTHRSSRKYEHHRAPRTTPTRLGESLVEAPFDPTELIQNVTKLASASKQTVLYLAYGSNLCRETFQGKRGIKPVSQVNVVVPQLVMTFDLPGLPYTEPCFANTRYRRMPAAENSTEDAEGEGYHKDLWHKGLVGVVYEVTLADYAHIIATEGGGASYEDVLVDCYALPDDPSVPVPVVPSGNPFKAHTLFAPAPLASAGGRLIRPDPGYAQSSPRYLKLITDGADELNLPYEYQDYLHSIRGYQLTTTKQRLGQFILLSIWAPLLAFVFGAGRLFADKKGRYPPWLTALTANIFTGIWASYDNFFKGLFGDGERTMGPGSELHFMDERQSLLSGARIANCRNVLRGKGTSPDSIV
jgi:hypothetical protein